MTSVCNGSRTDRGSSGAPVRWRFGAETGPTLDDREIHLWVVDVDTPKPTDADLQILSVDEEVRASQFRFETDRSRYVRRRKALRLILGHYLGVGPREVTYSKNPFGKPDIARDRWLPRLTFNTSHSQGIALIAVSRCTLLGIDIERLIPLFEAETIAARHFAAAEAAAFMALNESDRIRGFYNAWTRKEAVVKALGAGLSIPLAAFEVSLRPEEPAAIVECRFDPRLGEALQISHLEICSGYVGALAYDAGAFDVLHGVFEV